jgi:hypothetical protein
LAIGTEDALGGSSRLAYTFRMLGEALDPIGEQCRTQGFARIAFHFLAIKAETHQLMCVGYVYDRMFDYSVHAALQSVEPYNHGDFYLSS